jgi:hypothetical protein
MFLREGKARPAHRADNLIATREPVVQNPKNLTTV